MNAVIALATVTVGWAGFLAFGWLLGRTAARADALWDEYEAAQPRSDVDEPHAVDFHLWSRELQR